jgi:deoxyribodipyrimidine photolyase-related protein
MSKLVVILGDQLNTAMSSLQGFCKSSDQILLSEVKEEASYVKHHKKKIAFIFSAMRHFHKELIELGFNTTYIKYDDENNKGSIFKQVEDTCKTSSFSSIKIAHPGEYRLLQDVHTWQAKLNIPVEVTDDNRFIASKSFFSDWAKGRKQYRMEFFYRELRKKTGVLMEDKQPKGGKWNYDAENRKPLGKNPSVPSPSYFEPDSISSEVISLVENTFSSHFGELDNFNFAVTRQEALSVLRQFIDTRLHDFGQYQDAMLEGDPWLFHSHLGLYINTGLLMPDEVIRAVEEAYLNNDVPINSAEGFIRQILGWREYVRGFYWHFMPDLKDSNYLGAKRNLPDFYWTANTRMNCLSQCISDTKKYAYAHHIQRLMVLGNFALLTGLEPKAVNEWYLLVYADAYEWVEMPNVSSMVLYADGGKLASKPYAASGSYINKMSNYCRNCDYNVKEKTGPQACPFNYLYWHFIHRHKDTFENNPRMAMIYNTMSKMDQTQFTHMLDDADTFLINLENNEEV